MKKKKNSNLLSLRNNNKFLQRIIRVNHAGEYGAIYIYSGQEFIFKNSPIKNFLILREITEMKKQEEKHFHYFNKKIKEQKIRPTVLLPIWRIFGMFLGVGTAIISKKAAMACTIAVEEVIEKHYKEQFLHLKNGELKETIGKFRDEELKHKNIAIKYNPKNTFGYKILSLFIKTCCKSAIYLSRLI
ncbi:MAG: demethoxyubiquinone hydroxylase family protein [Wolbachia endosymbiont of Menacanthus eurysternus]|nr:MAG: demethoxyubiquinone hydroxylase family protein [Wolbachia endosymbiont of Menacanthus eurysternus]